MRECKYYTFNVSKRWRSNWIKGWNEIVNNLNSDGQLKVMVLVNRIGDRPAALLNVPDRVSWNWSMKPCTHQVKVLIIDN